MIDPDRLAWERMDGLIPAIVQDALSGEVRMLGYMDRAALAKTIESRRVTFFSRSKQRLWTKGESSGNTLDLISIAADCDGDALLIRARPNGPTCHTGAASCFGGDTGGVLATIEAIVAARATADPATSYTARLLAEGTKRIAQKVGEEGVEVALAGAAGDSAELAAETADLIYHLTVLLHARGLGWDVVADELARRHASSATASA